MDPEQPWALFLVLRMKEAPAEWSGGGSGDDGEMELGQKQEG